MSVCKPSKEISLSKNAKTQKIESPIEIPLATNKYLLELLDDFKTLCRNTEKNRKRDCKKRFLQLGLVARVAEDTTYNELYNLLENGTHTFIFDSVKIEPKKLSELVVRTNSAIDAYQRNQPKKHVVVGLGFEILGDCCRLGRLRHDCSVMLCGGDVITLTTNKDYHYSGYKEVSFVINLEFFLTELKLRDPVHIGKEARGCVVKKFVDSIVVHINKPGLINSYEYILLPNQCQSRPSLEIIEMFNYDLSMIKEFDGQYIVLHHAHCRAFLQQLREYVETTATNLKIIGSIDFEFVGSQKIDLCGVIDCLDYLWIENYFESPCLLRAHILDFVVPKALSLYKPIIGTVPVRCCNQFKGYQNHPFLWLLDSMFIEKSHICLKYPSIVRHLLILANSRNDIDIDEMLLSTHTVVKVLPTTYRSRIDFILNSICCKGCRAMFLDVGTRVAENVSRCLVSCCPIYIMLPWDKDHSDEDELDFLQFLARGLNLRRNVRPIIYDNDMNIENSKPLDYGIEYTKSKGCIQTGDYIITIELVRNNLEKESEEDSMKLGAFILG